MAPPVRPAGADDERSNNHDPYHFPEKLACGRVGETANVGGRNELPGHDRRYAIDARKIERGVG